MIDYDTATFDEIWKKEKSLYTLWAQILCHNEISRCYNSTAGYISYTKDYKLHRLDGPAYISQHSLCIKWYKDHKLHRIDGPAVIKYCRGNKYNSEKKLYIWAINGQEMSEEQFQSITSIFSNSQNGNKVILL